MTDNLRWDTTRLYPSPSSNELEQDFIRAAEQSASFRGSYLGKVAELDSEKLFNALIEYEKLQEIAVKPQLYSHLLFASDSENDIHKSLMQKAMEIGNELSRMLLFFDLEIMAIPEEQFEKLIANKSLFNYIHYLKIVRKFQPYTLSEREEQLLKQKNLTGVEAFSKLFDELTSALTYRMKFEGKERDFTGEELLALLHHTDAAVRELSFTTFLVRHAEQQIVLSTVINNIALDHGQELELRGYSHPMQPTNIGNELTDEAVEHLMKVTESNYGLAQDYFKIKAGLLGIDKLKNTDIYAPVEESTKVYSYEQARRMVTSSYSDFNPEYGPIIDAFFTELRIDVSPRKGKSGGAFCMGMTPSLPPYLLLNFTGTLRDIATLAHELGHGLHYVLAQGQTMINYHAPLPLAETASVFGEMLLARKLLDTENDRKVKISILCAIIEDIIATTFRQVVLTRFEQRVHLERREGLLNASRICDLWWEENGKLFGDTVTMIEPYRWGWSYISHFIHTRFYCYAYTFAELLVISLYAKYEEEGTSFVPAFDRILRSGGALSPADTALKARIDINDPGFWQKGYDVLAKLIKELNLVT